MNKYGVDEGALNGQKTASIQKYCPKCNKLLIQEGHLLFCPEHGSEPFETHESPSR